MKRTPRLIGASALLLASVVIGLGAAPAQDTDAQVRTRVAAAFEAAGLTMEVVSAQRAQIPGLWQVRLANGQDVYTSEDGAFLLTGDLFHFTEGGLVNLAEQQREVHRAELMSDVPLEDMIVFSPAGETRAVVNVFTDIDCGYCQKLHREVPELNRRGIEVRYLAYPRAGIGSASYDKIVTAWCSDDRQRTLTRLKAGENVAPKTCKNPVAREYALGQEAGVQGTPALVLENGRMLPGYLPADKLAEVLGVL